MCNQHGCHKYLERWVLFKIVTPMFASFFAHRQLELGRRFSNESNILLRRCINKQIEVHINIKCKVSCDDPLKIKSVL